MSAPSKGVLRMLRCTFCEAAASNKTGLRDAEVLAFFYEHAAAQGHPGTIEGTWRGTDGALTRAPLDTSGLAK
jgi:hypothetical protein